MSDIYLINPNNKNPIDHTKPIVIGLLNIDLDKDGGIVGIECLGFDVVSVNKTSV